MDLNQNEMKKIDAVKGAIVWLTGGGGGGVEERALTSEDKLSPSGTFLGIFCL